MYLPSLIRTNRAIAASLIYPEHPFQAIAASEFASVLLPLLNPDLFPKILATTIAIMYNPLFADHLIKAYHQEYTNYNLAEICCLLLFILTVSINYIQ
tara:strand:+ start:268 stop:561 length:294 start_codon:yes stop_codon:yes gene_type:complete